MKKNSIFKRIRAFVLAAVLALPMSVAQMPVSAETDFLVQTNSDGGEVDTLPQVPSGGNATFLSGTNFNAKIKEIAGHSGANFSTADSTIKEIAWSDSETPAEYRSSDYLVSTSDSEQYIFAWMEDGTMYLYTEADHVSLNNQANFMFYELDGLESIDFVSNTDSFSGVDTSGTEDMINMFGSCGSLTSLDLSWMDTQNAENMNDMFHDTAIVELTLGRSWEFNTATGIPRTNWMSSSTGEVWSYAALETLYASTDAATFTSTSDEADVLPDEELFMGDGLGPNNMFPVDDESDRFTGFCINDEDEDPYGYYRKVEIPTDGVNWENWFHTSDYGYQPIGGNMREALITLLVEGTKALDSGTLGYDTLQNHIWHFTSHYSDSSWDGTFWENKSFKDIEDNEYIKLYVYESLEGKQNVISIEGVEKPETVDVTIAKVDSEGNPVSGAELQLSGILYNGTGYGPEKYTSDELNSNALYLYPGEYTLSELTVPDGFLQAEDITFTVGEDGSISSDAYDNGVITMVDEKITLVDVTISKQDMAGNEIAGARLTVTDQDGNTVDTWISVEGESHIIEGLTEGRFTLTEITAPDGFEKAESIDFQVTEDGKVTVNGNNEDTVIMVDEYTPATVVISKQDIAGAEIAGAELTVTDSDGKIVDSWTSQAGKSHEIESLLPGTYTLSERVVPDGYEKAEDITFDLLPGGKVQVDGTDVDKVVMTDEYTPYPVTFRKIEYIKSTETMLSGAKLTLQDENGKAVLSWTTDGSAKTVSLTPGTYKLVETEAPTGYEIADPITFTMAVGGAVTISGESSALQEAVITMIDPIEDAHKEVKILKTGMDDEPLAGATLRVYHMEDGKKSIDEQWTSSTKTVTLSLIPGEYYLEELSAPSGYIASEDIKFTVQANGRILVGREFVDTITVKNEPTVVGFSKVDEDTNGRISGARLQVLTKSGSVVEEWTSSEHIHHIRGKLAAGEEYILHESAAPEGYEVADDITFKVNNNSSELSVVMKDKAIEEEEVEYGTIQVYKTVEGTGADTTKKFGFIISLMDSDNNPFTGTVSYVMSDGNSGNLTFDSNGRAGFELSHGQNIIFRNVESGYFYTITELDYSAEGYTASVRDRSAQINEGENIIHFVNTYGTASATVASTGGTGSGTTASNNSASGVVTSSRDTGDASNILVWVAVLTIGLAGIAAVVTVKLRRRK